MSLFYNMVPHTFYNSHFTEKGGTVFRPVAKSRPRAPPSASRQASLAIEGTISLPGADALPPTQSSSSLYSAQEGQHGGISNHETASLTLTGFPHGGATIDDVNVAPSMPPRQPTVPPIIGSSSTEGMRSRSAVPTVIATPRAPMQKIFQPASQSSSAKAIAPPEKHLSAEPAPLQSSIVPIPYDTNASSIPESSCSPSTSTNSNSTTQIPDASKFAPKAAPRKRKISARSAKEPKQRASASIDAEDVENVQEGSSTKKPRSRASSRASSSTPKLRRRAPSPPVYDPDADPGEDLDPTSVTMAELCSDTGQGRVSRKAAEILSNHAAWKARNREKRARMRQIMEAKKYGREAELENEEQGEGQADPKTPVNEAGSSNVAILDDTGNGFDYSQDLTTSRFNVQVRIGPNGETVIDEESLVVDRAENDGTESYTHVIESDQTKFVNSGSYGKRYRGSRWSAEETELFYDVSGCIVLVLQTH